MNAEMQAAGRIARELGKIRVRHPDEAEVRDGWLKANANYREHVLEGRGDKVNGDAIMTYYVMRQAYFMYAQERGFSLEVN